MEPTPEQPSSTERGLALSLDAPKGPDRNVPPMHRHDHDDRVAGYYALAAGSVGPDEATSRLAAGAGRHPIPVVVLARLGVDLRDQGRGLGQELVYDALLQTASIAERIGARALVIEAESPRAAAFYTRLDPAFEPAPLNPLRLVLLMKDLRRALTKASRVGE